MNGKQKIRTAGIILGTISLLVAVLDWYFIVVHGSDYVDGAIFYTIAFVACVIVFLPSPKHKKSGKNE